MNGEYEQPTSPEYSGRPHSPLGHRLLFVLFIGLSFTLFAPTVLLPFLKQHGELLAEEAKLKEQIKQLEDEVRRRAELTDAFQHDSVVNERLAVLDLGYRKPNQEVMEVRLEESASGESLGPPAAKPLSLLNLPADSPPWALKWERWAQRRGLIELFLDSSLRPVFLLMSGGLLIAAFVLFAPRVATHSPHRRVPQSGPASAPSLMMARK